MGGSRHNTVNLRPNTGVVMSDLRSEIDAIGINRILRALGVRLSGFLNLAFGSPECAERELFGEAGAGPPPQAGEPEDGHRMLKVFIENYALIAEKAEWRGRFPLLCAQVIEAWFAEQRSENTDLMFLAALRQLLDATRPLGEADEVAVISIESMLPDVAECYREATRYAEGSSPGGV